MYFQIWKVDCPIHNQQRSPPKGQSISKCLFWCLQFLPKNERKQVDLMYHSSKVEFVCLFFGRNVGLKKSFWLCLTFNSGVKNSSSVPAIATCQLQILNLNPNMDTRSHLYDNIRKNKQTKTKKLSNYLKYHTKG